MPYDAATSKNLSDAFREFCSDELEIIDLRVWESMLQQLLGIANIRNVQLWTRRGAVKRDFINNRTGEYEYDLRVWIAERLLIQVEPNFPVKQRVLTDPSSPESVNTLRRYVNDNWIREYGTRIFFEDGKFIIEYSADSSNNPDELDLESDEFSDVVED